ncbi:MAG: molybdopterin-dependent oxidoreductase, partial [Gammaproteobacteria bacterium]
MRLAIILWGIPQAIRACALIFPKFKERLKERDCIAQFALKEDANKGRWIQLKNGRIATGAGIHTDPTFTISFKNAKIAADFLTPPFNQLERIHAAKNFQITMAGPDTDIVWFMHLVASMESYTWTRGTDMGNGVTRYTNGTNGGPIFVYVKDGKILRTTPMDLDDSDPDSYTIKARGKTFKPPRKTTLAAHG